MVSLLSQLSQMEGAVRVLNTELEQQVAEQTAELQRSNAECSSLSTSPPTTCRSPCAW